MSGEKYDFSNEIEGYFYDISNSYIMFYIFPIIKYLSNMVGINLLYIRMYTYITQLHVWNLKLTNKLLKI